MTINIIKRSSLGDIPVDGSNLINRQGQAIDTSYMGKKYQVLSVDRDYYSLGERIGRICKAFFQVLFTLGFILCSENKRAEIYDLFCATMKSQQINATRYKINSEDQHRRILSLLYVAYNDGFNHEFRKDSLDAIVNECKNTGYHINLDQWHENEVHKLLAIRDVDIIAHFIAKHKGPLNISSSHASLLLREIVTYISHSAEANHAEKKAYVQNACSVVRKLVESGADVNALFYEEYGNHDTILSICLSSILDCHPKKEEIRYVNNFCGFSYPALELRIELEKRGYTWPTDGSIPDEDVLADLPELTEEETKALPKPSFENLLQFWTEEATLAANSDRKWKLPYPEQFQELCNSLCEDLLVDFRPLIALLVSFGAQTTVEISPDQEFYEQDYDRFCNYMLTQVKEEIEVKSPWLTFFIGHQDAGASFASLPKELVSEIGRKMLPPVNVDIKKVIGWSGEA